MHYTLTNSFLDYLHHSKQFKAWFCEVYSAISNGRANYLPEKDEKLYEFIKNPWAYIATMYLMIPFIIFIVGAYIPDYGSSKYEVVSSAREAGNGLGFLLIVIFLLSNIQATILLLIILCVVCGFPILCIALCYFRYHHTNGNNGNKVNFDGNNSCDYDELDGNNNFDTNNLMV